VEQENVEVVRSVVEAFAERDEVTPFKHYAPDIEWEDRVAGVVAVHHGHGGVRAKFYDLLQAFREF
jgi:ketosteroid isomerase-like protein